MVVMYVALYMGYAYEIEVITLFSIEMIIIFLLYREHLLGKYKNYYYMENYVKKATVTVAQKKNRPIIKLWGDKGFFKRDMGVNISKELSINGFFIRVDKEIENV